MGIITSIITAFLALVVFLVAVVGNAFSRLLADDAKVWLPKIVEHLLRGAVNKLPDAYQERYNEEWRARLDEMPGDLAKLVLALRFQYAAWEMRTQALGSMDGAASDNVASPFRLLAVPLLLATICGVYTAFRGLADFFDLPTHPSINPGQFAFGFVVTIIVIGFVVASRPIWSSSDEAPFLFLKAASVVCVAIDVAASWVGTKHIISFDYDDPGKAFGLALVIALAVLSKIGLSTLLFDNEKT